MLIKIFTVRRMFFLLVGTLLTTFNTSVIAQTIANIDQALPSIYNQKTGKLLQLVDYHLLTKNVEILDKRTDVNSMKKTVENASYANCSDIPQETSLTVSSSVIVGDMVQLTKGFTSNKGNSTTISFTPSPTSGGLGGQVGSTSTITLNTSTMNQQSFRQQDTRSEVVQRTIPPKTLFRVSMERIVTKESILFRADTIAHGDARLVVAKTKKYCAGPVIAGSCLGGWLSKPYFEYPLTTLEQQLTEAERTFPVEGWLHSIDAKEIHIKYDSSQLSDSSPECISAESSHQSGVLTAQSINNQEIEPYPCDRPCFPNETFQWRPTPACGFNDLSLPINGEYKCFSYCDPITKNCQRKCTFTGRCQSA